MKRVLIIESDGERAQRLRAVCHGMRLETSLSPDPLHALMLAANDKPELILVDAADDWQGPMSVAESFKRFKGLSSIPVVVVGNSARASSLEWPAITWN